MAQNVTTPTSSPSPTLLTNSELQKDKSEANVSANVQSRARLPVLHNANLHTHGVKPDTIPSYLRAIAIECCGGQRLQRGKCDDISCLDDNAEHNVPFKRWQWAQPHRVDVEAKEGPYTRATVLCRQGHAMELYMTSGRTCRDCASSIDSKGYVMICRECNSWLCPACRRHVGM
jgi:hypothetical protein